MRCELATYDLAVIGAGPGGYVAAVCAARQGLRVALIEKDAVGGLCLNRGCIPSKILLQKAAILWRANKMRACREIKLSPRTALPPEWFLEAELPEWIAHWREKVDGIRSGLAQLVSANGVEIISGAVTGFMNTTTVVVELSEKERKDEISAKNFIIATGSKPKTLLALPIDGTRVITSNEALLLTEIPRTLAVVGGGVIGCEFATLFSAIGSNVTIIDYQPQLLPGMETEISKTLQRAFRERGIETVLSCGVAESRVHNAGVTLSLTNGEAREAERVLVAVGIQGGIGGLGLENAGVKTDRGFISVDPATYRTNVPNIFAIGDVIALPDRSHPGLAHVASCEGEIAAEVIAHGNASWRIDYDNIPMTIFTDPEIGTCGITQPDPTQYVVQLMRDSWMGIGMALDEPAGFTKLIIDTHYGAIAGACIIGHAACERIHEYTIARRAEETVRTMSRQVMAHPTYSESVREALYALDGRAVHVPLMHQKRNGDAHRESRRG